jgi:hypothetical protein
MWYNCQEKTKYFKWLCNSLHIDEQKNTTFKIGSTLRYRDTKCVSQKFWLSDSCTLLEISKAIELQRSPFYIASI